MPKGRSKEDHYVELTQFGLPTGSERITCGSLGCRNDARTRTPGTSDDEWEFVKKHFIEDHPCRYIKVEDGWLQVA